MKIDINQFSQKALELALSYGPKVLAAVVILLVGRAAAKMVRSLIKRVLGKTDVDPSISGFAASLAYWAVFTLTIVAVLSKFGVETTSFVAILGAAGFAVGFALKDSLSNFAAGIMVLLFKPFRLEHFIDAAGVSGTVKSIDLFTTTLHTPNNVQIIVPNGKLFGDIIKNFSANDTRRVDIDVGIGYGCSIEKAFEVILKLVESDERALTYPKPEVMVTELADSSVNLQCRVWSKTSDYWALKFELNKRVKEELDANNIEIPFPQRVVHNA